MHCKIEKVVTWSLAACKDYLHSCAGGRLREDWSTLRARHCDALLRNAAERQRLSTAGGQRHLQVEILHCRVALPEPLFRRAACMCVRNCKQCRILPSSYGYMFRGFEKRTTSIQTSNS